MYLGGEMHRVALLHAPLELFEHGVHDAHVLGVRGSGGVDALCREEYNSIQFTIENPNRPKTEVICKRRFFWGGGTIQGDFGKWNETVLSGVDGSQIVLLVDARALQLADSPVHVL